MSSTFADRYSAQQTLSHSPFDAFAQLSLAKHASAGTDAYGDQVSKAALHFSSPFLLFAALRDRPVFEAAPAMTPVEVQEEVLPQRADEVDPAPEQKVVVPEKTTNQKEAPLFEPLHASDYFASQGIKLSEAEASNDKLGVQLKTFTAWLKTMKKLHTDRLPEPGIAVETAIQTLAEKSNIEEPVLTEAMAEAFAAQGKTAKAAEVYRKLGLLNPAKSGYFAAKIDNIKGNS